MTTRSNRRSGIDPNAFAGIESGLHRPRKRQVHSSVQAWCILGVLLSRTLLGAGIESQRVWKTHAWGIQDGLPQQIVTCVAASHDGWLWLGTLRGLARFDGARFERMPLGFEANGSEGIVHWVGTDPAGHVWAGRDGAGIVGTADVSWRRDAGVWHKVYAGGIPIHRKFVCGAGTNRWLIANPNQWVVVTTLPIAVTKDGFEETATPIRAHTNEQERITTVTWIHPWGACMRLASGRWKHVFEDGNVEALPESALRGLEEPVTQMETETLCFDPSGSVWGAGRELGLIQRQRLPTWCLDQSVGLSNQDVWSLSAAPDGTVWISARHATVNWRFGETTPRIDHPFEIGNIHTSPRSIAASDDSSARFFAYNQLYEVNASGASRIGPQWRLKEATEPDPVIGMPDDSFIFREPNAQWIAGTPFGIYMGTSNRWFNALEVPAGQQAAFCGFARVHSNEWWVGNLNRGVIHQREGQITRHDLSTGAPSNRMAPICAEADGGIWFGTQEKGLVRRMGDRWEIWDESIGMPENTIISVFISEGEDVIWAHGLRSIYALSRSNLFSTYTHRSIPLAYWKLPHGRVASAEGNGGVAWPNSCRDTAGNLWFAGTKGATIVPNSARHPAPPRKPVITAVETESGVEYKEILEGVREVVDCGKHGNHSLSFRVAHPALDAPNLSPLRYQLEGVDPDWIPFDGLGEVRYRDLPPGRHRFHVAAFGPGGTSVATLTVILTSNWSETPTAKRILFGLIFGAVLIIIYQYIQSQRRMAERQVQQRAEQDRWRIARDLHDSMGANLLRLALGTARSAPQASEQARNMILELDRLVWAINPKNDDLESCVRYLIHELEHFAKNSSLGLTVTAEEQFQHHPVSGSARRELLLFMNGCLSNVLKHSKATRIEFVAKLAGEHLRLEWIDNGCGFDATHTPVDRVGLRSLVERAKTLQAQFRCDSKPGRGTRIQLLLPLDALSRPVSIPQ